jgi:hypothetical protein
MLVRCICSLLAFTENGKWELILVKLRLERNEQAVGVLLARLLDGARSIKEKALVLEYGSTTS